MAEQASPIELTYTILRTGTWAVWLNRTHWIGSIREGLNPSTLAPGVCLITEAFHRWFPTHIEAWTYLNELLTEAESAQAQLTL